MSLASCKASNDQLDILKLDLTNNHHVTALANMGDSIIVLGGYYLEGNLIDFTKASSFLLFSDNYGKTWNLISNMVGNSIRSINIHKGIIIIQFDLIMQQDEGNHLHHEYPYYILNRKLISLEPINLPSKSASFFRFLDDSLAIADITREQFGHTYLYSIDCGESWKEYTFFTHDLFEPRVILDSLVLGIGTNFPDTYSISSLNIKSEEFNELYTFDHNVLEIELFSNGSTIYVATYDDRTISIYLLLNNKLLALTTFEDKITKESHISSLYSNDTMAAILVKDKSYLPKYSLIYKKFSDELLNKIELPVFTYSCNSFDQGQYYFITTNNTIVHVDLNHAN